MHLTQSETFSFSLFIFNQVRNIESNKELS